jgi:type IV pilus biogenesis/stability protein PilW
VIRVLLIALALTGCVTQKRVKQSQARTDLGTAYLREGNPPDAVQTLREATQFNPQNGEAWERLGLAYMASNALEESEGAFKRALRLAGKEEGRVHYNYGMLLVRMERYADAVTQLEATLSDLTYRTPSRALNSLGFVHYKMGDHDKAITRLSEAIRRSPKMCQARFHRALAYEAKADKEAALNDFEAVIQTCGSDAAGAYLHAAPVLFELDQREAGCDYLKTAQKVAPNTDISRAAGRLHVKECQS